MKKFFTLLAFVAFGLTNLNAQVCESITFTTNPSPVLTTSTVTITTTLACPDISWTTGDLYVWLWANVAGGNNNNGEWTASAADHQMTNNGDGTYSYTLNVETFFGTGVTEIGFLVKALDGTGDNKTPDQTIAVVPAGIANISAANISVYPNPSNGLFTVKAENDFNLNVVDVAGKLVYQGQISNNVNTVNLTNVQAGMYFFKFSSANNSYIQRVIVK